MCPVSIESTPSWGTVSSGATADLALHITVRTSTSGNPTLSSRRPQTLRLATPYTPYLSASIQEVLKEPCNVPLYVWVRGKHGPR